MGNTKHYYAEGVLNPGATLTQADLEGMFRGYACVRLEERGYLNQGGGTWFCAAVHSYSMRAGYGIKDLARRCSELVVHVHDMDGNLDGVDVQSVCLSGGELVEVSLRHMRTLRDLPPSSRVDNEAL